MFIPLYAIVTFAGIALYLIYAVVVLAWSFQRVTALVTEPKGGQLQFVPGNTTAEHGAQS